MTHSIDVLVIEPSASDARRTLAAIRRKAPAISAVHVSSAESAAALIFDYWPVEAPQVPRLMIVDLANSGEPGKAILRRLGSHAVTRNVPTVLFSAHLTPLAELEGAASVSMDILKPIDCEEYDLKVASVLDKWLVHRS
jgi:DNA-binding response OmpR family regulator